MQTTVRHKSYNGMLFHDYATFPDVRHEFAYSVADKLIAAHVPLTFQIHQNAYAHEPELMLSSWSFNYPVKDTRGVSNSQYWRDEIILARVSDRERVRALRDFGFELFTTCDAILQGIL